MKGRTVAIVLAVLVVSSSFIAAFYYGVFEDKGMQKVPGPYVVLLGYANNGTKVVRLNNNLSVDVSVWVPSMTGSGSTVNLNDTSFRWNRTISLGGLNFTRAIHSWQSFANRSGGEPTMSSIITYTKRNGNDLYIYEYYSNLPFNPFSSSLTSQVFIENFTIDLNNPFTIIRIASNNATIAAPSTPASYPLGVIGPGPCPPGDVSYNWKGTLRETGWYPITLINATS